MNEKAKSTEIKVLLVEDHPMFRERMAMLINKDMNMSVCGEADNIQDAMTLLQDAKPDIAIVDLTLKGSSGLELIKNMKASHCEVPVLVLSMHDEALYAERVLRAGAKGYITKNEASSRVMAAIHRVLEGGVYLSEPMTARVLQKMSQTGGATKQTGVSQLTDRELEVFRLLGYGHSSRDIASQLGLGEATVNSYRFRIREKMDIKNAAELYNRAAQWVQEQGT